MFMDCFSVGDNYVLFSFIFTDGLECEWLPQIRQEFRFD